VLFEGNGYSEAWHAEAEQRGLPNNKTTVDALPALTTKKAKDLFSGLGVLSERELASRWRSTGERYVKIVDIEASTALDIASTLILPAAARYLGELNQAPSSKGINAICQRVSGLADSLVDAIADLQHAQHEAHEAGTVKAEATAFATEVIPAQAASGRSSTSSRRSSPTTSGRCRSTASCSSSTDRRGGPSHTRPESASARAYPCARSRPF
jgi:glutamine synthetase